MKFPSSSVISYDLIGKICSYLDLPDVKNVVYASSGNVELASIIRSMYLKGNFEFLRITRKRSAWKQRRENTIAWMQCNDWKRIFYNLVGKKDSNICEGVKLTANGENSLQAFVELIASVEMGVVEVTKYLIEEKGYDVNENVSIDNGHFFQISKSSLSVALTLPDMEILHYLTSRKELNVNCRYEY